MKTSNAYEMHRLSIIKNCLAKQPHQAESEPARDAIRQQLKQIEDRLSEIHTSNGEPVVSEHAIIRWLERVKGMDMEAIKEEILAGRQAQIRKLGTCTIKMPNGMRMIVRGHVVVTIIEKDSR